MNNIINERVARLRELMKDRGTDMYFIPTSDYHDSEYVNDYFRGRAWLSGFTGSAGVMVVTQDKAVVWSDGRYFIQAEQQLRDTCIDFYRQGVKGYPTTLAFIHDEIKEKGVLGFDGKVVSAIFGENLAKTLQHKHVKMEYQEDLLTTIWKERPSLPKAEMFILDEKYAGISLQEKVQKVREKMQEAKATTHILTSLDDIAWLLNVRGHDIENNPVVLSYVVITQKELFFYVDKAKMNDTLIEYFKINNIIVRGYDEIYLDIQHFDQNDSVLIDKERCNYAIVKTLANDVKIIGKENPTTLMKAIKNDVEIANLRISHIKDGIAVTKFMYWLKNNVDQMDMDEVSAMNYLLDCRKAQKNFIEESFTTIAGYNENAAMMHYSATAEKKAKLQPKGILLVDSGGQYYEGTTDITRTFALGPVKEEWKKDFTLVLKGMIQLSKATFLEGCTGINLDILARQPLWDLGIDYQCGTGHGVGFLLNVHEGPQGFRWKKALNRKEDTALQAGMVITNEPGVYIEGSHGIRIENEMIVRKQMANEYGQFMDFETITFAPIDIDLIDVNYLDEATRIWLNKYHQEVYQKISPSLNEEEKAWLKVYTREL